MSDVRIRPMTAQDVAAAERVTAIGFHELDTRMFRRSWPDPQLRPPERSAAWVRRTGHLVATDPGGCWVAERDAELLGVVVPFVREKMWLLASYAVVPAAQGLGLPGLLARRSSTEGLTARDAQRVERPESGGGTTTRVFGCTPDVPAGQA